MEDKFFSKSKNSFDDTAEFDNTLIVNASEEDRIREAEYYRQKYYSEQYEASRDIPISKAYRPPFMQDDIPVHQLPFEQTVGNPAQQPAYNNYQQQAPYRQPQYQQAPQQPYYNQPVPQYQPANYPPVPENEPPKKKRRRKKRSFLRPLVSIFLTVVLLIAATVGSVYIVASTVDYNRVDLEKNQYISASELNSSKDVINILFLGADGKNDSNSLRSDSIMLISIDSANKKIKLTSFLRDSWVEIPSKGKHAKLNAAFAYGGAQLAVDTIEYNFHIDIDHYVMVNFEMFTQIIDNLGGIDVEVTEKEARFINKTTRHTIESGESVHLNGAEALVYVRIRKLDSDYMRTFRQRKVITALINKAKESNPAELYSIVTDIFPLIQTDMSAGDLTSLFFRAGYALIAYDDIQQTQAPIEGHFKDGYAAGGQWVEFLDLEAVREYLYKFIYTNELSSEEKTE